MNDPFASLPNDVVFQIALRESIQNIPNLCRSSIRLNNLICNNNSFWREKFIYDFGSPDSNVNIISWKEAYENYGKAVAFGNNNSGQLGTSFEDENQREFSPTLIPNIKFKSVYCSDSQTIAIDLNNNVWAWGSNFNGQLGLGDDINRSNPTLVSWNQETKARSASCGREHTVLIDLNNNVWACGNNKYGQLGLGNDKTRKVLTQIPNIKAKSVACGGYHTMLIDLDNNVWAFGSNKSLQLGLGDQNNRLIPTQLPGIQARVISCGSNYTMIIDMNNDIWACGWNSNGQLGLGDTQPRNVPTRVEFPENSIQAQTVSCGSQHTMIIDMNNNVWVFGRGGSGQLGIGDDDILYLDIPTRLSWDQDSQAKFIACGLSHTMLIDLNDNLWACGFNGSGQLGIGDDSIQNVDTLVKLSNIKAQSVACGSQHTVVSLGLDSQLGDNVKLLPFNEIARKLNSGDFLKFEFLPEHQVVPHNPSNYIASFYGKDNNIYLSEIRYDQSTNLIYPPI